MAKKHLKRLTAPATWMVDRKESKFIARPKGSFSLSLGMPLITILKDSLKLVSTRKEGKHVLNTQEIIVNGIRRKDESFMVGLMDVLSIPAVGKSYRMLLDKNNVLRLVPVTESESLVKPCKVTGKRLVRAGKVQLSLHDGHSYLGTAAQGTGDTIVRTLPKGEVTAHLKLEKGCQAYLIGGSNVGKTGSIENVLGDTVTIKLGSNVVEAARRFVFVIGKEKPVIKSVSAV